MWLKMLVSFIAVFFFWDFKSVFYTIWSPLKFLTGYSDPRRPTDDLLHGKVISTAILASLTHFTLCLIFIVSIMAWILYKLAWFHIFCIQCSIMVHNFHLQSGIFALLLIGTSGFMEWFVLFFIPLARKFSNELRACSRHFAGLCGCVFREVILRFNESSKLHVP